MVKIAIIQFPGTNTERETSMAVRRAGMEPIEFLWNHDHKLLSTYSGFIIAGGFSYEDRSRAGIIASLDPLMNVIKKQAELGKPVLGICNGAQILIESGLIPGLNNYQLGMALTENKRIKNGHVLGTGYYNSWTYLALSTPYIRTAFTRHLKSAESIYIPFAHAEGRFVMPEELLNELFKNQQIVFRYCDSNGNISSEFPINPNGSMYNIAAVCNPQGNVMALMPHPERTENGGAIFTSMREYIEQNNTPQFEPLEYFTNDYIIKKHITDSNTIEWFVESIITDNEAVSVQKALDQSQIPVIVNRQKYWQINFGTKSSKNLEKLIFSSGELFNSNKERLAKFKLQPAVKYLLVRPKEDLLGRYKTAMLKNHFNAKNLTDVKSGILWEISGHDNDSDKSIQTAINTNIFFNPNSHNCYEIQK